MQDGFNLYLHGFIVTDDGSWVVVQQGMNGDRRQARRYHWLSEGLQSFVDEPHAAIDGIEQGVIVNLTDRQAAASRQGQLDILCRLGPDGIERQLADLEGRVTESRPPQAQPLLPYLVMPDHHDVRAENIVTRRLHGNLAAAAESGPADFSELLLVPGVGARTIRALAMVAEVVHGAPYRFSDPARFSRELRERGCGVEPREDLLVVRLPEGGSRDLLWQLAAASGEQIRYLRPQRGTLEEVFLKAVDEGR